MTDRRQQAIGTLIGPGNLRIFISSTFRNLQRERDALARHAFPQLRAACASRSIRFSELDLRWGITDEERLQGRIVPICLSEIDACRPYFIGIVGSDYYGWRLGEEEWKAHPELLEPLKGYIGRSLTELEFRHAGLGSTPAHPRMRFYLARSSAAGPQGLAEPDARSLEQLRADVRTSGFPWREFSSPEELSRQVLEDFSGLIEQDFPSRRENALEEHWRFAEWNAQRHCGRQRLFATLTRHTRKDGPPLLIQGPEGIGKTALLASWAISARSLRPEVSWWRKLLPRALAPERNPPPLPRLLPYFTDAAPGDGTWPAVLRHWLQGLDSPPDTGEAGNPELLRERLLTALRRVASAQPVILLVDGLDQLERRGQAGEFLWLPESLPRNVRLLGTARDGHTATRLRELGWRTLEVGPLEPPERLQLLRGFLAPFGKRLAGALEDKVLRAGSTANPRYLRLLLDEMRQFPAHEELPLQTESYLTETRTEALAARILRRVRSDFVRFPELSAGVEPAPFVRDALLALLSTRDGLEEAELRELLGPAEHLLPASAWSCFRLNLPELLTCRSGRWTLAHDAARSAVEQVFAPDPQQRLLAHQRLSRFFATRAGTSPPALEAHLWHLARAEDWTELARQLSAPRALATLWRWDPLLVQNHWAELARNTKAQPEALYERLLENPGAMPEASWAVGQLLLRMGRHASARRVWLRLLESLAGAERQMALGNLALACMKLGHLEEAHRLLQEQERGCERAEELQACLGNQAALLLEFKRDEEAEALLGRAIQLSEPIPGTPGLARHRANQALIAHRKDAPGAGARLDEAERDARRLGDAHALMTCLGIRGTRAARAARWGPAMRAFSEQERLCRALGAAAELQQCLGRQVSMLMEQGDYGSAAQRLTERKRLCESLADEAGLAECARQFQALSGVLGFQR